MKPEYDVEIDHYYFAFECDNGHECDYDKIDVDDDDDFISCLKDYSQDYEQNPELEPVVYLSRTDFFNQEYNEYDDVIDEDLEEEWLVSVNLEDCTVEFFEQNEFDKQTLKGGFEHLEDKLNAFLKELKQSREERENCQNQEQSLEQNKSRIGILKR